MNVQAYHSSSKGNCYIIDNDLMIDPGIPIASIKKKARFKVHGIRACLVSHEH